MTHGGKWQEKRAEVTTEKLHGNMVENEESGGKGSSSKVPFREETLIEGVNQAGSQRKKKSSRGKDRERKTPACSMRNRKLRSKARDGKGDA